MSCPVPTGLSPTRRGSGINIRTYIRATEAPAARGPRRTDIYPEISGSAQDIAQGLRS